jgi:hypothetical protein
MHKLVGIIDNCLVGVALLGIPIGFVSAIIYGEESLRFILPFLSGLIVIGLLWFRLLRPALDRDSSRRAAQSSMGSDGRMENAQRHLKLGCLWGIVAVLGWAIFYYVVR